MDSQIESDPSAPAPWLRHAVRGVLEKSNSYQELPNEERRTLAKAMVRVSKVAADLIDEENQAQGELNRRAPPLARAQDAPSFGAAADKVASTTHNILNAVSFPRFVTDLVTGVFRAMIDSSAQQMRLFVNLLNSVSTSLDGFASTQYSIDYVTRWLADHFPDSFEIEQTETDGTDTADATPADPADVQPARLKLRNNASMPSEDAIRTTLGMQPDEQLDASSPNDLVPLARRQIARQQQQMLATMVMLGMQRIVVDSGRITAAMHFHIDTHSAENQESGNTFSFQNRIKAGASGGVGIWSANAEVENTIGYVSTQRSQSTEEMNTDLDLSSSVEINFRTDYLPLNRMAASSSADRIRANSLNPDAEMALASKERQQRAAGQQQAEQSRMKSLDEALAPPKFPDSASGAQKPAGSPAGAGAGAGAKPAAKAPAVAVPNAAASGPGPAPKAA